MCFKCYCFFEISYEVGIALGIYAIFLLIVMLFAQWVAGVFSLEGKKGIETSCTIFIVSFFLYTIYVTACYYLQDK